jgi:predicted nuclease with TOPRIM domain
MIEEIWKYAVMYARFGQHRMDAVLGEKAVREYAEQELKAESIRQGLAAAQAELLELQARAADMRTNLAKLRKENNELRELNVKANREWSEKRDEIEKLRHRAKRLKNKLPPGLRA